MRPGRGRHDHHPIGQQDRLRDAVGDEQDGLAPLLPDAEQLEAHLFPGHRVQRAERLVHQQQAGIGQERAADGHRCCMPPDSSRGYSVSKPAEPGRAPADRRRACGTGAGRARASRPRRARCRAPSATGSSTGCWKTKPTSGNGSCTDLVADVNAAARSGGTRPATSFEQRALAAAARPDQRRRTRSRRPQGDVVERLHELAPRASGRSSRRRRGGSRAAARYFRSGSRSLV